MPADQRPGVPPGQPEQARRPGPGAVQPEPRGTLQRRSAARTAVVWDALRTVLDDLDDPGGSGSGSGGGASGDPGDRAAVVVDVGGGTGGFAVRAAELGHRVVVVDPSPDALATLARRAEESGVADRVTGRQGDLDDLPGLLGLPGAGAGAGAAEGGERTGVDVVLCHGVLEIVDDPSAALAALAGVLRPGGTLSLLVNQRHAAVVARAMAGHFQQARSLLDHPASPEPAGSGEPSRQPGTARQPSGSTPPGSTSPRRFTADEVTAALDATGFDVSAVHAVRVFVDLVPSSLVDQESGAAQALVELERAVATRPEYLPLATQVHVLAIRR